MSRVTEADFAALRSEKNPSGYRHVYEKSDFRNERHRQGLIGYEAAPFGISLGRFEHPRDAARAVIEWLISRFGEDWQSLKVRANRPWSVDWATCGGYYATVYVRGRPKILPGNHKTKREARRSLRRWIKSHPSAFLSRVLAQRR